MGRKTIQLFASVSQYNRLVEAYDDARAVEAACASPLPAGRDTLAREAARVPAAMAEIIGPWARRIGYLVNTGRYSDRQLSLRGRALVDAIRETGWAREQQAGG